MGCVAYMSADSHLKKLDVKSMYINTSNTHQHVFKQIETHVNLLVQFKRAYTVNTILYVLMDIGDIKAVNEGLCNMQYSSTDCYSVTPPV